MTTSTTFIPLESSESASLNTNTLLPKAVYEELASFIRKAIKNLPIRNTDLNDLRSHNAISIDGARGTGKTSVLVNLKRYLEQNHKDLLDEIQILEPIDPTLLEDDESLFLHVLVAAVLHDKDVKETQRHRPEQARVLQQCLERLANGLESVETQRNQHGMDKIRALYGNKHLANCVQDFFRAALDLLGKKLLVLPLDDVDTSLHRAFENLEIIRRYLTTPYVLPIVSGDRSLYNEVTWRDFHGRMTKDSSYKKLQAYAISENLANEYQRKILPLPRRLTMPPVSEYWQNSAIKLRGNDGDILSLQNFYAWLEIFVSGPVNGLEGSRLPVPIPSIRALSQLINHCGDLVLSLPENVCKAENVLQVRRGWQMPTVPLSVIEAFHSKHQELSRGKKREYGEAYRLFTEKLTNHAKLDSSPTTSQTQNWAKRLAEYFRFEPQAGAVYLVLIAHLHWHKWATDKSTAWQLSIFDTPLFQPLQHSDSNFDLFEKQDDLSDWATQLKSRLPESWLTQVKDHKTILPYPVAEVGINSGVNWKYWNDIKIFNLDKQAQGKTIFLISLLTQHNFYTKAKQSMMLNIGRIFELIVSSLAGPLELADLQRLVQCAPFFSTSALAPTKVVEVERDQRQEGESEPIDDRHDYMGDILEEYLIQLQQEISEWRKSHDLDRIQIAPWLVYKVFNKVYSQVSSAELVPNGMKDIDRALEMAGLVFYSTWSAFGSFEKGQLFGLPNVVATVNLNSLRNFEKNDHYLVNLGPFAPTRPQMEEKDGLPYKQRSEYGKQTRTVSYLLADHPLRFWIDSMPKANDTEASRWLLDKLGYSKRVKRLELHHVWDKLSESPIEDIESLITEAKSKFPNTKALRLLEEFYTERCTE